MKSVMVKSFLTIILVLLLLAPAVDAGRKRRKKRTKAAVVTAPYVLNPRRNDRMCDSDAEERRLAGKPPLEVKRVQ